MRAVNPELLARGSLEYFEAIEERDRVAAEIMSVRHQLATAGLPYISDSQCKTLAKKAPPHPLTIPDRIGQALAGLHNPIDAEGSEFHSTGSTDEAKKAAHVWARRNASAALFAKHISKTLGFPLRKYKPR